MGKFQVNKRLIAVCFGPCIEGKEKLPCLHACMGFLGERITLKDVFPLMRFFYITKYRRLVIFQTYDALPEDHARNCRNSIKWDPV